MMKDRIKQLRKELHMSQTEFASSIGLHRSTISSYECGRVEPPENIQNSICQVFKVNRRWLSDGEGGQAKTITRFSRKTCTLPLTG